MFLNGKDFRLLFFDFFNRGISIITSFKKFRFCLLNSRNYVFLIVSSYCLACIRLSCTHLSHVRYV